MPITLSLREPSSVPIEVEGILPQAMRGKSREQIGQLRIFHGNRELALSDLFDVQGEMDDETLVWEGDLSGVHWIGAKMHSGLLRVAGDAGRHVGSEMTGGSIQVAGNASDWVGGEMRGGLIHVRGRAGHLVGAAYRGSSRGMTGGCLLVEGDVGNELGHSMRRGLVAVGGQAGDLVGFNMIAGTILVFGACGIRHGAGMRRGTIGLLGPSRPALLPSFRRGCRARPPVMPLLLRSISRLGMRVPDDLPQADLELYHGDLIAGGRGELWVR